MSVKTLDNTIRSVTQDNQITKSDMTKILDRTDTWLEAPKSIGDHLQRDEIDRLKELQLQIARGTIRADPGASKLLDAFVENAPDASIMNDLKTMAKGATTFIMTTTAVGTALEPGGGTALGFVVGVVFSPLASVAAFAFDD